MKTYITEVPVAAAPPRGTLMATSTDSGRNDRHRRPALMRELHVSLPAPVSYASGPDLVFEFANEEYLRTVGGRDLIGLPIRAALPELSPERLAPLEHVAQSGQPLHGQASEVWIRQNGAEPEQMFVDFSCLPVRDASGEVAGVLLYLNDVTPLVLERRRREKLITRLARTEERYRTLFETLPHGVIHYSADNSVIGINPAASQMLGLTGLLREKAEKGIGDLRTCGIQVQIGDKQNCHVDFCQSSEGVSTTAFTMITCVNGALEVNGPARPVFTAAILSTTFMPEITLPKTAYPQRSGCGSSLVLSARLI